MRKCTVKIFLVIVIVVAVTLTCMYQRQEDSYSFHSFSSPVGPESPENVCLYKSYDSPGDFEGFNNITGDSDNCTIIPNYVHFVKFKQKSFSFPHTVCILSALKNQNPDKIYFHTNVKKFEGKYWNLLMQTPGFKEKVEIVSTPQPTEIFGQPLNKGWLNYHSGDVTRLRVLMQYGGIYLDNDSCIIRNMDYFRRFEISLGWLPGKVLGNMIIVAHKNARLLKLWYNSYDKNYFPKRFYYNAGDYPANHILKQQPYLVHREEKLFGNYGPFKPLYLEKYPEWRTYYGIHTLSSHLGQLKRKSNLTYPVKFDENNIMRYPVAYRDLVLSVFPNNLIKNLNKSENIE